MEGSRSRREYIENAIRFYTDYLEMNDGNSLLPRKLIAAIDGRVGMLENFLGKLVFKLAAATDLNAGLLADVLQISEEEPRQRRAESVKDAKQTNGLISFEQRVRNSGDA